MLARHHPGRSSSSQCPDNKTVSVVTRSAYGDKQLSRLDSTGVNRDTGQPCHRVEARRNRDTQRFSHLNHGPPHRVSNELGCTLKRRLLAGFDLPAAPPATPPPGSSRNPCDGGLSAPFRGPQ